MRFYRYLFYYSIDIINHIIYYIIINIITSHDVFLLANLYDGNVLYWLVY